MHLLQFYLDYFETSIRNPDDFGTSCICAYTVISCRFVVKTITPRCCGRPDALLHQAEGGLQYLVHQVVHGNEG